MGRISTGTRKFYDVASPAARSAAVAITLMLGACAQSGGLDLGLDGDKPQTSDIATASAEGNSPEALEKATAYWGEEHRKNPTNAKAALSFAKNLKALDRKPQALNVLQSTYTFAGDDREFLSEYGRLSLELGQLSLASQLLARADDPAKPDWKLVSARGTIQAKEGNYKEAIRFFEKARTLSQEQPTVLSNLAMAYAMDGRAQEAETLLLQAAAANPSDPRIQQNLSLVRNLKPQPEPPQPVQAVRPVSPAPAKAAGWDAPLPIEQATAKTAAKASAKSKALTTASTTPSGQLTPEQIMQQALAAEQTKPKH